MFSLWPIPYGGYIIKEKISWILNIRHGKLIIQLQKT